LDKPQYTYFIICLYTICTIKN